MRPSAADRDVRASSHLIFVAFALAGCGGNSTLENTVDAMEFARQSSGITQGLAAVGPGTGLGSTALYAETAASGAQHVALKYDAGAWAPTDDHAPGGGCLTCRTPLSTTLAGVSYSAGPSGQVQRYDTSKATWVTEKTGLAGDVLALFGAIDGRLFAVGDGGGIAVRASGSWSVMKSPTDRSLRGVWGAGGFVYAVGDLGVVARFDGAAWSLVPSGTLSDLRDVWLSSELGVFAVGDDGVIIHRKSL